MNVQLTGFNTGSTTQSATRSTTWIFSMTTAVNTMEPYESESSLVSHNGPSNDAEQNLFVPMSGPLYTIRQFENLHQPMNERLAERSNGANECCIEMGQADWPDDDLPAKHEHLLKSGPLGRCNDPFCTTCPTNYDFNAAQKKYERASAFEHKFHGTLYGDTKGWVQNFFSSLKRCTPGIMNPHTKVVQHWNKFFVISCFMATFVDPLFCFLLSVHENHKCIIFNWSLAKAIGVVRSFTDFIYFLHMLLQFRLAYIAPETVVGARDLVDHPKKIALHYLRGYFLLDLFVALPLPQIMFVVVLNYLASSEANYAKSLLFTAVHIQYVPRMIRFLPLLAGQSATGFIFESMWAIFVINLLILLVGGHVIGSSWYFFGVQRVNQCLQDVCSQLRIEDCRRVIDCGHGTSEFRTISSWTTIGGAYGCFVTENGPFDYGIYRKVALISTQQSVVGRYVYSLFWGFQQISTLAGNLDPSYFVGEVVFTMGIVGVGLFGVGVSIGNVQNFIASRSQRRLEMQLRRQDAERWMDHWRLPDSLKRQVRQAERFRWGTTRGVDEDSLMSNLPEDLQSQIHRYVFRNLKKVHVFRVMEAPFLDAIGKRLRQQLYIGGSTILYQGGPIDKMVFIVGGKMESIEGNGNPTLLSEGDVCGEELLTWCLDYPSWGKGAKKFRSSGQKLLSKRTVRCLTNVEAFALRADDLEEVAAIFPQVLENPRVQAAIRYESPYWRANAAMCIQAAWRYRKKRLRRLASCKR